MLEVQGIETCYGVSKVLFGMSLKVDAGEVVTLMGRNGMGKTTTIRSIMGLTPPVAGRISFEGNSLENLSSYKIARMGLGLVPEGRQVFPTLTVRENLVSTASNRSERKEPWTLERVYEMFPRLRERSNHMGTALSGGEQQMLAIARALMTNPKLLILDEATEGLAPLVRNEIWACIKGLKESSQAILVVDKNIQALSQIADRHYFIEGGKVAWQGTSKELGANFELAHTYLGV